MHIYTQFWENYNPNALISCGLTDDNYKSYRPLTPNSKPSLSSIKKRLLPHFYTLQPSPMAPAFVFETSNDEEHDDFQPENEEEEEAENEDEEEQPLNKKTESPWDFAPYYESVVEEHTSKSITSIDFKIIKALQNCTVPIIPNDDDSEFDSDKQEVSTNLLSLLIPKFDKSVIST